MNAAPAFSSFVKVFQVALVHDEERDGRHWSRLFKKPFEMISTFLGPSFSCLRCKVE